MKNLKQLLLTLFFAVSIIANAQVSELIDAGGTAIVEKAQTYYAKVFTRKNYGRTEYIWYTTDANGKKLRRGGRVRGTGIYFSLAEAEAALPATYTLIDTPPPATDPLYIMGMLHYGHWNTTNNEYVMNSRNVLNDYQSNGYNSVMLEMYIQDIWKQSATDRQNGILGFDKAPDWTFLEQRLTPLLSRPFDVAIRINLVYARKDTPDDFAYHYNYWGNGFAETDEWGNVPEVDRGKVPMTLADDAFRAKMAEKVRLIVEKAHQILGTKLKFVSTVRASTNEWGYDHRGMYNKYVADEYAGSFQYFATFCYNPKNRAKYQNYLRSVYNNSTTAISSAWGRTITDFGAINLPITGTPYNEAGIEAGTAHTFAEANSLYNSNEGYDFWMYKNYMQNLFGFELRSAIKSVRNDITFVGESGGFSFNLGLLHGTYDIASLQQVFDLVKGSTGIYNHCLQPEEGWDFVSGAGKKFGDELSWFDLNACGFITNTSQYKINLKQRAKSSLQLGHNLFLMIDDPTTHYWGGVAHSTWTESLAAMSEIRTELGNERFPQPANASSINVTLQTALASSGGTAIKDAWTAAGGSPTNRVKINMIVSPTSGGTGGGSGGTVEKSTFVFNQKSNGTPTPEPSHTGNGYTLVSSPSHGITRTLNNMPADKGTICKFEYEIINSANEVVVSMKDNYGGFHPNFKNEVGAESYYRVWTPSFPQYSDYAWIRDFYNNFTSISGTPFATADDRGNNHFSQYQKYFVNGNYTLKIKNTGDKPFEIRAGANSNFENSGAAQVYTTVAADGEWKYFNIYIGGITEMYKLNIYNY